MTATSEMQFNESIFEIPWRLAWKESDTSGNLREKHVLWMCVMQVAHTVVPNNQVVAGSSHVCGRSNSFGMGNNPQDSSEDATFSKRRPAQYKVTTSWDRGCRTAQATPLLHW